MRPLPLALLLLAAATAAAAPPPLTARLKLRGRPEQKVELLGRAANGSLRVRAGAQGEIGFDTASVKEIEFAFPFDPAAVQQLYYAGQYGAVVTQLQPALAPTIPFLGFTNNALPHVRLWLQCLYWDGQYDAALALARELRRAVPDPVFQRELRGLTAAALVGAGRTNEVGAVLQSLVPVDPHSPEAAPCWYAGAQLAAARKDLPAAQEDIARLIAFRRHDPDWMPPALWLSAQWYAQARHPDVARQIVKELNTLYPNSRWAVQAAGWENTLPPPAPAATNAAAQDQAKPQEK